MNVKDLTRATSRKEELERGVCTLSQVLQNVGLPKVASLKECVVIEFAMEYLRTICTLPLEGCQPNEHTISWQT